MNVQELQAMKDRLRAVREDVLKLASEGSSIGPRAGRSSVDPGAMDLREIESAIESEIADSRQNVNVLRAAYDGAEFPNASLCHSYIKALERCRPWGIWVYDKESFYESKCMTGPTIFESQQKATMAAVAYGLTEEHCAIIPWTGRE